ncbi:MAG: hypothetical protein ACI33J_03925 [Clostridium sp.]|nr:hypothetical protein [Clostridium sp.]
MKMDFIKHKYIKIALSFFLVLFLLVSLIPLISVQAEETDKIAETMEYGSEEEVAETEENNLKIIFENGIHYIMDPSYPYKKLILYCMNNESHWPHEKPDLGGESVPDYKEGYLTPHQFESKEKYEECMQRLNKILFTGYPYNGNQLYKIVPEGEQYVLTEENFNQMLVPSRVLVECFPILKDQIFTLSNSKEKYKILQQFIQQVYELYPNGIAGGKLSYLTITSMPFYKAVLSITWTGGEGNPIDTYMNLFPDSYYVTEEQAYNATQYAVWQLLCDYGVEDNNFSDIGSSSLGQIIYDESKYSSILITEPAVQEISVYGDTMFQYNPQDGKWHTGTLRINEPYDYYGVYNLELPQGITISGEEGILSGLRSNAPFELVSDHLPTEDEKVTVYSEISWLKETKQYSPNPDKVVNGKRFQHMIGAVVMSKSIEFTFHCKARQSGNLIISKRVEGEMGDRTKKFPFAIYLYKSDRTPFTGSVQTEGSIIEGYEGPCEAPAGGELVFDAWGKATVELSHGQKITIKDLPIGCQYNVSESEEVIKEYQVSYNDSKQHPQGTMYHDIDINVVNRKEYVPDTGILDEKRGAMAAIWIALFSMVMLFGISLRKVKGGHQE